MPEEKRKIRKALEALGFEISANNTVLIKGNEIHVEEILAIGLPAIFEFVNSSNAISLKGNISEYLAKLDVLNIKFEDDSVKSEINEQLTDAASNFDQNIFDTKHIYLQKLTYLLTKVGSRERFNNLMQSNYFKALLAYNTKELLLFLISEEGKKSFEKLVKMINVSLKDLFNRPFTFSEIHARTESLDVETSENSEDDDEEIVSWLVDAYSFIKDTKILLNFLHYIAVEKSSDIWNKLRCFLYENDTELDFKQYLEFSTAFVPEENEILRRLLIHLRAFFAVYDDDYFDLLEDFDSENYREFNEWEDKTYPELPFTELNEEDDFSEEINIFGYSENDLKDVHELFTSDETSIEKLGDEEIWCKKYLERLHNILIFIAPEAALANEIFRQTGYYCFFMTLPESVQNVLDKHSKNPDVRQLLNIPESKKYKLPSNIPVNKKLIDTGETQHNLDEPYNFSEGSDFSDTSRN